MLEPQNEARQVLALLAVQSGRRLIEQHDRRFERQRSREADELLQSERQVANRRVAVPFELHNVDDPLDGFAMHDFGSPDAWQKQHLSQRVRSEEHTSELQSLRHLVCRLLLEKKKKKNRTV